MSLLECLPSAIAGQSSALPRPQFAIGDRVASDCCDGKSGEMIIEFGEIVESSFLAGSWIYFVNWTHSSSPDDSDCYPDCDGQPVPANFLRIA